MEAPGTATFKGEMSEVITWQSPTSYTMTGGVNSGEKCVRCC